MKWLRQGIKIEPAAPAIVMAIGIFFIGAMEYFPFIYEKAGYYLAIGVGIVSLFIYSLLIMEFGRKADFLRLIHQPIRSFALGTWVAAISVLCNVLLLYFPEYLLILQMIALFNLAFFVICFTIFIRSFYQLYQQRLTLNVDGIVLLSTVSMQSVVIMLYQVFGNTSSLLFKSMILIGLSFYLIGLLFIIQSYRRKKWDLVDDWANTNCIIHGALSITGLAMVTTNVFPQTISILIWWLTFGLLIIIESIEIVRAVKRTKRYALRHGLFSYHVTQWSRNFTFGMFFAFTYALFQSNYPYSEGLYLFHGILLDIWAWVVYLFLLLQIALFLYGKSTLWTRKRLFK